MLRIQRSMRSLDRPTKAPTSSDNARAAIAGLAVLALMTIGLIANAGLLTL